jgi:hypothetical protein
MMKVKRNGGVMLMSGGHPPGENGLGWATGIDPLPGIL